MLTIARNAAMSGWASAGIIGATNLPGSWYAALAEAAIQPAELGVRTNLDRAVHHDRSSRLENVSSGHERLRNAPVVRTDAAELRLVTERR